jgi:hypothetical protein
MWTSGRIEGTAGTQLVTFRPLALIRSIVASSSPSGSFISQIPIPSAPAAT